MPAYVPGFDYDVFVSYAHVDNVSLSDDPREGWVYTLKDNLKKLLSQKLGRADWGDIWIDYSLPRDEPFPKKLSDAVQSSVTLLVVLSEGYLESDWCRQERELFLETAGRSAVNEGRVFLVRRTDLKHDCWPEPFHGLLGYEFFTKTREEVPAQTLGWPHADPKNEADRPYFQRVDDLSGNLKKRLQAMKKEAAKPDEPPLTVDKAEQAVRPTDQYPVNIFLAETTPDLGDLRDQIRRHLGQEEIGVLPDAFYERAPAAFKTAMEADLERSLLFVQLLGQYVTPKAPGLPAGYEGLQLDLARSAGKPILRWHDPDLDRAKVQNPDLLKGQEVMVVPFEDFKGEVVNQVRRLALHKDRQEVIPGNALTLIRVDSSDMDVAIRITESLKKHRIGFDIIEDDQEFADLAEDEQYSTHALMVVYGQCERSWTRAQLRNCRRIVMHRRLHPPVCAVYVDPRAREPLGMQLPELHILSGLERGLETPELGNFFEAVQKRAQMSPPGL